MDLFSRNLPRVHPETQVSGLKSQPRQLSRVNGWSLPLHPFQAVVWATYLVLSVVTFGIVIPLLPSTWKYISYSVTGVVFVFHWVVYFTAVTIDPAEANVRLRNYSKPMPIFDRSQHAHVIQNQYCHLCEVTVNEKAKHCSSCNKCIAGFDHHCEWLNNCVGSRNYWFFFCSVASALVGLLCVKVLLLYVCIQHFINPSKLRTDPSYKDISTVTVWLLFLPKWHLPVKTPVALCMMGGVLLVGTVSFVLLSRLFIFHICLLVKSKTTFDYIRHSRLQQGLEPPGRTQLGRTQPGRTQLVLQVEEAVPQGKEDSTPALTPPSPGLKRKKFLPASLCSSPSSTHSLSLQSDSPPVSPERSALRHPPRGERSRGKREVSSVLEEDDVKAEALNSGEIM